MKASEGWTSFEYREQGKVKDETFERERSTLSAFRYKFATTLSLGYQIRK
jgi:hypothetical protein